MKCSYSKNVISFQRLFSPGKGSDSIASDAQTSNDHNDPWTLKLLVDRIPDLGLVIDLTNTSKYYNPKDLPDERIEYVKIFTRGHEIPSRDCVQK